ncbi:MAG: DUF2460 domain-containing protein [Alphaproteobacteria bacterium]|nr:DUF2460 domain-containing protein [Alphaproteobacteria bacterium]
MVARLNLVVAETAAKGSAPARVNYTAVEVPAKTTSPLRLNAIYAESAAKGDAPLRLAFVAIESLILIGSPPTVNTEKFPLPPGLGWSVHVAPKFKTRVADHVSGREIRTAWQQYAIYDLTLTFEVLRGDATQEIQTLMGFFMARRGQYDTFLLDLGAVTQNTADSHVTMGAQGTGDGTTTVFTLIRTVGEAAEPVGYVFSADLAGVYVAGVLQDPTSYSFASPNTLTFNTAPTTGSQITASFRYYFVCRFAADAQDFEEFMANLWTLHELKLVTVLP